MSEESNVPAVIEMEAVPPTPVRTLDMVASEIKTFAAVMLTSAIEIGRRFVEAKAMLPHGQFGAWVEECTDFAVSTANNYMRLYTEYGAEQGSLFGADTESDTIRKLSTSQALALLALPADEREAFAEDVGAENLSVRQLKEEINEYQRKQAATQAALEAERNKSSKLQKRLDEAPVHDAIYWAQVREEARKEAENSLQLQIEVTKDNFERSQKAVEKLRTELSNEKTRQSIAESKAAKAHEKAIAKLEADLKKAEERAKDAEERARNVQLTHERNIEEEAEKRQKEATAELRARLDKTQAALDEANNAAKAASEAESKLRQELAEAKSRTADSGKAVAQFELLFQQAVSAANQMREIMLAARQTDKTTADKLSGILATLSDEIRRCAE